MAEDQAGRERPRVLRDVKLLYLSLDLEPGPYGSIPEVVTDARPVRGE